MATSPAPLPADQQAEEAAADFRESKRLTVPVDASRLASGTYDHNRNRESGEGDIHAAYSADTIATSGKVRKAFRWQAQLMVTVSLRGRGVSEEAEAYQLIPAKVFTGIPTTYGEKTGDADAAEAARNDPKGFYHGMKVTQGLETFVLSGPPVLFVPAEAPERPGGSANAGGEQLSLF